MTTCGNTETGDPCGDLAVATLSIHLHHNDDDARYGQLHLCLRHLIVVMVRNGIDAPAAVTVIEQFARRTALDILRDEERKHR
jgi:hypothetical protein